FRFSAVQAYPPRWIVYALPQPRHHLRRLVDVDLRINFCDLGRTMPEHHARRVQAGLAANLRCLGVSELVGMPVRDSQFEARLIDRPAVAIDRVAGSWLPPGLPLLAIG